MIEIDGINFPSFMEEALYGEQGFYTLGGGAGRTRDYITSPEVGDLFGRVVASYIDEWYESLETDEPAIVVDVGCGLGSLAASIARAHMRNAQMIDYFLVDRSQTHLETCDEKLDPMGTDFSWSTYNQIPECEFPTLIIANELLDNLVFDIGYADEMYEPFKPDEIEDKFLGLDTYAAFGSFRNIDNLSGGNVRSDLGHYRVPRHTGIANWFVELSQATSNVSSLTVLLFDYMKSVEDMEDENWMRFYSDNLRIVGVDNVLNILRNGTTGDITADIIKEDLNVLLDIEGFSKIDFKSQSKWLNAQGIDIWCDQLSQQSGYDQLKGWIDNASIESQASSFSNEREILMDENGLGAFTVVEAVREI